MSHIPSLAESVSAAASQPPCSDPVSADLFTLAETALGACSGTICIIAWQGAGGSGFVRAPAKEPRLDGLASAALGLLAGQLPSADDQATATFRVSAQELAVRCGRPASPPRLELRAVATSSETAAAISVLMVAPGGVPAQLQRILELAARAALAAVTARQQAASREFWRARAEVVAGDLERAKQAADAAQAERRRIDEAAVTFAALKPRNLATGIGSLTVASGPFDGFVVALEQDGALTLAALSHKSDWMARGRRLEANTSALLDALRRATPILRLADASSTTYDEDREFARAGFLAYLCVPFETGVVALPCCHTIDSAARMRAETLVARLAPTIKARMLERELQSRHSLAQSLALRLFGAIDAERARIARDLHDDQAQLLTAARIALKGRREAARRIFQELEEELRLKVRALRPAPLGRTSLRDVLEAELRRLADAGIEGRLLQVNGVRAMPRPIQKVCYQVAREALSNIVRHSRARNVTISLERIGSRSRLSITDDGRGIAAGESSRGLGLGGLTERVELLGGNLKIESRPGRTRLVAEIPVR